ncbi:MAG: hypothetical protein KTR31_03430 [Myxococcales bacterium]|nr:hypothetical protein [Myxococcales bacterium]
MSLHLLRGLCDAGQLLMQLAARHEYAPLHYASVAPLSKADAEQALDEVQERGLLRPAQDAPHVLLLTPVGYALRDTVIETFEALHQRMRPQLLAHVVERFGLPGDSPLRAALHAVDRARFVPEINRPLADLDLPAPLAVPEATTSAPHAIVSMLEALKPRAGERVLVCGIKGGVTAALCAHMVGSQGRVVGIDTSAALVSAARRAVAEAAVPDAASLQVHEVADVTMGLPGRESWHVVVMNGSTPKVPRDLLRRLDPDRGRLLLFLQEAGVDGQTCYVLRRDGSARRDEALSRFVFTPLYGRWGWDRIGSLDPA